MHLNGLTEPLALHLVKRKYTSLPSLGIALRYVGHESSLLISSTAHIGRWCSCKLSVTMDKVPGLALITEFWIGPPQGQNGNSLHRLCELWASFLGVNLLFSRCGFFWSLILEGGVWVGEKMWACADGVMLISGGSKFLLTFKVLPSPEPQNHNPWVTEWDGAEVWNCVYVCVTGICLCLEKSLSVSFLSKSQVGQMNTHTKE